MHRTCAPFGYLSPPRLIPLRDPSVRRAVLAVLIGYGRRRGEVAAVSVEQFRIVEEQQVVADLIGKHGCGRTVAVPSWVKAAVDEWRLVGSIASDAQRYCRLVLHQRRYIRRTFTPAAFNIS